MTAQTMRAEARDAGEAREFRFTPRHFERIRALVRELTGITLGDLKQDLVYARLSRRLRRLGLADFDAYLARIEREPEAELGELVNAITTNLTAFFREPHHFEHLAEVVLPALLARPVAERRIRIWSAGCSTGEEPYSIAMTVCECLGPRLADCDVRILATDIDTQVLARAEAGVYALERLEGLTPARRAAHFQRGTGAAAGQARVRPEVRALVHFRPLNLNGPWPMRGPFDVVFCRNVVIYFDKPTQRVLFERMAALMTPDAHLYIGHSENLFRVSERFELIGRTIHRLRAEEGA